MFVCAQIKKRKKPQDSNLSDIQAIDVLPKLDDQVGTSATYPVMQIKIDLHQNIMAY
jgi:hypothetical protein